MAFETLPSAAGPDAIAMASLIATGEVDPDHFVAEACETSRHLNPDLNAVIHERYDDALEAARRPGGEVAVGPLRGVPFLVKDLGCEQKGEPHYQGTRFLRDEQWTSERDSHLWERFEAAGLVSLGRTNAPEFGSTITTEPLSYGPTRNPWNLDLIPGGSSGGASAAVAAGIVPIAHGNDGGGSIRVPAAMCGLVGLKPSRGRVSVGPQAGTSLGGFAVDGVLTRTVRDTALGLDIVSGYSPGDPYTATPPPRPFLEIAEEDPGQLRIGIVKRRMHPVAAAAVEDAGRLLEDLGHEVTADTIPKGWFSPAVIDNTTVVRAIGMARTIGDWEERLGRTLTDDDVEPQNLFAAELGRSLSGENWFEAMNELHAWTRRVIAWWDDFDILLSPVVNGPTPPIGYLGDPEEGQRRLLDLLGFVDQANVSGQPAMSLPLGRDDAGMPVGVQFVAAPQREDVLLRLATQIEAAV